VHPERAKKYRTYTRAPDHVYQAVVEFGMIAIDQHCKETAIPDRIFSRFALPGEFRLKP